RCPGDSYAPARAGGAQRRSGVDDLVPGPVGRPGGGPCACLRGRAFAGHRHPCPDGVTISVTDQRRAYPRATVQAGVACVLTPIGPDGLAPSPRLTRATI